MKKFLFISLISMGFWSCGGGDEPIAETQNRAPSVPVLVAPSNGKVCLDTTVSFEWENAIDPEKDVISYQIEIAKDKQFSKIIKNLVITSNTQNISLTKGILYYWRVKAIDSKKMSSKYSLTYNFYTEAQVTANHLPNLPIVVLPALSTTLNPGNTTLQWKSSDPDVSDIMSYDVYFGLNNPPTSKVAENKTSTSIDVSTITLKRYYWKVVVKDNKGGQTIGQVWNFKTN